MSKEKKKNATGKSQFALVWHQFKKNKGGIFAMIVLGIIIAVAVAAPFIWSYETMAPSKNGRWIFTVSAALLTIGFYRIGMGVFGITFAIAFSDLLIPFMTLRFVKRI